MKDQVFTGRSVAEAVDAAARSLGIAADAVRYVVLEREGGGALGVGRTPARIAVLLEGRRDVAPVATNTRPAIEERKAIDPRSAVRAFVREFSESSGLDVTAEIEESEGRLVVRLFGEDRKILLEAGGELLLALDHVLQRAFGREAYPRRLILECEGFREARDSALADRARELAAEVRRDRRSRETEPLNAYERRIVHIALSEDPEVRTFSVGEGPDRRVTVALRDESGQLSEE